MSTQQAPKKSTPPTDWHRAEILCQLKIAGWSLRKLSLQSGLAEGTVKQALDRPYPKCERIIAAAIGVAPEVIWPERYAKRNFKPVLTLSSPNSSQQLQCAA